MIKLLPLIVLLISCENTILSDKNPIGPQPILCINGNLFTTGNGSDYRGTRPVIVNGDSVSCQ